MCLQKRWLQRRVDWGVPHQLEKGTSLERGGHEAVCQQGCWTPKEGGLWRVPHQLEKGTSLEWGRHEAVCQQGCWAPKEGGLWRVPHQLEKGTSLEWGRHEAVCQQGCWAQKEVDWEFPQKKAKRQHPLHYILLSMDQSTSKRYTKQASPAMTKKEFGLN